MIIKRKSFRRSIENKGLLILTFFFCIVILPLHTSAWDANYSAGVGDAPSGGFTVSDVTAAAGGGYTGTYGGTDVSFSSTLSAQAGFDVWVTSNQGGSGDGGYDVNSVGGTTGGTTGCFENRTVSNGKGGTTVQRVAVPCPDLCTNIAGVQATVPAGYTRNSVGQCVRIVDLCSNIAGVQATVPAGYTRNTAGQCVRAIPTIKANPNPIKVCDGTGLGVTTISWTAPPTWVVQVWVNDKLWAQKTGSGSGVTGKWNRTGTKYTLTNLNKVALAAVTVGVTTAGCPTPPPPAPAPSSSQDVCPNLPSTQTSVPAGYHLVGGQCGLISLCSDKYCEVTVDLCTSGDNCVDVDVCYLRDDGSKRGIWGCLGTGTISVAGPELSITAIPKLVRSGNDVTVNWTALHVSSCTMTGHGLSQTGKTGSKLASNITESTVFTLSCETPIGTMTDSTTVNIVPVWQDI